MSLIITSSSEGLDETNQIGIAKPEQYKNHMKNSLMIEPDSEIAVESVKINRLPMLDAGAGIVGNFWFGQRLSQSTPLELSLSYIIPSENEIGRSLAPVDFADEYINTLREAYSLHPEIDSNSIEMNTQFDAVGGFTGYQFKIPQIGSAGVNAIPADTSEVGDPLNTNKGGDEMAYAGGVFTSQYEDQMGQLLPRHTESGPIALNGGLLQFLNQTSTFTYGLSRPYCFDTPTFWDGIDNDSEGNVGYSDPERVFKGKAGGGLGPQEDQFYDYAIQVDTDDKLRIYHSAPTLKSESNPSNSPDYPYETRDSRNGEDIVMSEIVYWNNADDKFNASNASNSSHVGAGPLTWSTASGVIAFETDGEKMKISVSGTTISSNQLGTKQSAFNASYKGQVPKPISQTCWKMYPTVGLWTSGDKATIQKYNGRTNTTIWANQPENSWITKSTQGVALPKDGVSTISPHYNPFGEFSLRRITPGWNNAFGWGHTVDCRDIFRPFNNEAFRESGTNFHTYRGVTSKVIEDYENIFITGRTERYMDRAIQQFQPNSGFLLGFFPMGFSHLSGILNGGFVGASFVSAQRPSLMSQHSSFIRVPTFTHETYNFGTGNPSKILFQVPRFDNSGTETGALYYQNNDKTYINLGNAQQLNITELDVQIVRKNETFVQDLTGSTEIVFHIRKKISKS